MKLSTQNQLWRVLGDHNRYALDCAKLEVDAEGARIVVTNCRVVAIVPVEVSTEDEPGLIHGDALGGPAETDDFGDPVERERVLRVAGGKATAEAFDLSPGVREFPDWRKVVPAKDAPCAVEFTINARYLYDLACALGVEGWAAVRLRVPLPDQDGIVRGSILVDGPNGSFGAIMPVAEPKETERGAPSLTEARA